MGRIVSVLSLSEHVSMAYHGNHHTQTYRDGRMLEVEIIHVHLGLEGRV